MQIVAVSMTHSPKTIASVTSASQLDMRTIYEIEDMQNLEDMEPLCIDQIPTPKPVNKQLHNQHNTSRYNNKY